jgi:single-strand DNA-binding protein
MNIVGRITKNAEVNALANDRQVVNFSVAINDSFKNKQGDRVEQTTFYNCSLLIFLITDRKLHTYFGYMKC